MVRTFPGAPLPDVVEREPQGWRDAERGARVRREIAREAVRLLAGAGSAAAGSAGAGFAGAGEIAPDRPLTALGLDSLAAIELAAVVEARLGVSLPLADLLDGATIESLAAAVEAQLDAVRDAGGPSSGRGAAASALAGRELPVPSPLVPSPPPAGEAAGEPLSAGQQALWFVDRLAPASAAYNLAVAASAGSGLDPRALGRALQALSDRHPSLRTTFSTQDGEARQVVHARLPVDYLACDSGSRDGAASAPGEGEADSLPAAAAVAYRPFDLEAGPLFRVRAWRRAGGGWLLLFVVHHLVTDFWSLAILHRDLAALYAAHCAVAAGAPAAVDLLPPAPRRLYADHVRREARALAGAGAAAAWDYWLRQLGGELPVLELATDRPRPAVQTWAGLARRLVLPADLAEQLRAASRAAGATLFVTLLAGWQALLARWTGQSELVIGTPTAGFGRAALPEVTGYFVNPVALRLAAPEEHSWGELLAAVRAVALGALAHQELPFALLAERLRPERDAARSPVFQALFTLHAVRRQAAPGLAGFALGAPGARLALGALDLAAVPLPESRALFDAALAAADDGAGSHLPLLLELNGDLFDAATAERMLRHLANLLRSLAGDLAASAASAELLDEAERRQLTAWNLPARALPEGDATLADLFAAQVRRHPGREALVCGSERGERAERLTYGELGRRVERLARRLRALGVGPEVRVGVTAPRSADLVIALLAVLRAGGAYVPLDPAQPAARRAWMLADARAAVLLAAGSLAAEWPPEALPTGCRLVRLDGDGGDGEEGTAVPRLAGNDGGGEAGAALPRLDEDGCGVAGDAMPADGGAVAGNLAYVIYTSGSTGRPKGVAIEHRSAVARMQWARRDFSDDELGGVLAATSIGFDLSVFELFAPLSWGGRVILAESLFALPTLAAAGEVRLINTVPGVLSEALRQAADEGGEPLPAGVVTVNLAGEPLAREVVQRVAEQWPAARVLNLYGPSEDTTYSTGGVVERDEEREPTLGAPLAGTRAQVLDRRLRLVPVGVVGELWLGGAGLARGYYGRPELTAERFLPDPFAGDGDGAAGGSAAGERLYRTGDLARRLANGALEFRGRSDQQVKIHGVRIEPAEVRAALLALPGVSEAEVVAEAAGGSGCFLAAYVVAAAGAALDRGALRAALARHLPRPMLPQAIVVLAGLPRTPHGKLDRRALAAAVAAGVSSTALPASTAPAGTAGGVAGPPLGAPRPPLEELLGGIWAEALGVGAVAAGDDFFALGGHSLLALRVQARVRRRLGVDLPLAAFFQLPTLAAQARELAARRRRAAAGDLDAAALGAAVAVDAVGAWEENGGPPLATAPAAQRVFPLSFAQERLWLLDRLDPDTAAYHMAGAARLAGPLDGAALAAALAAVASRHDALRLRVREADGAPLQEIAAAPAAAALPCVCLAGLAAERRDAAAAAVCRAAAGRPFRLADEPPLRALLVRLAPRSHVLSLTLHHVAADEASLAIVAAELAALYGALAAGRPAVLPAAPALRHADFAFWQRQWPRDAAFQARLAAAARRLAGLAPADLTTDRPRPPAPTRRGALAALDAAHLAGPLAALARGCGATLFMVLAAAFQALLERVHLQGLQGLQGPQGAQGRPGAAEVPLGTPVDTRDREPLLGLVGCFVNLLVLRGGGALDDAASGGAAGGEEEDGFRGRLRRTREETLAAHEHAGVPFELLVAELRPERARGRNPLFDAAFALQRPPRAWQAGGLDFAPHTVHTGTAKFDLTLFAVDPPGGGLGLTMEYAAELFDRATAERLLGHLGALLAAVAADPARRLAEIPLLGAAELRQVGAWSAGRALAVPPLLVHRQVERQARRAPDRLAVAWPAGALTYGELDRRAGHLARRLRRLGAAAEVAVAIRLPRSAEQLIAALAVLKAGGAYVPIDPATPEERVAAMLATAGVTLLVAGPGAAAPAGFGGTLVRLAGAGAQPTVGLADAGFAADFDADFDADAGAGPPPPGGLDDAPVAPGNLAYVVFTSGSTGTPKGVAVAHASLGNLAAWHLDACSLTAADRASHVAGLGFDAAVWEVWPSLAAGASLHLPAETARTSPEPLADWLAAQAVTVAFLPTPLAEAVLALDRPFAPAALRLLLTGGDRLRRAPRAAAAWQLVNHYGPSECTVVGTSAAVAPAAPAPLGTLAAAGTLVAPPPPPPIGRPIGNVVARVLDRARLPVAPGLPGELYLGGAGVARGYAGRPDLTALRFVPDAAAAVPGARLYRTGDRVRWLASGELEFLGRVDDQVKIQGVRIEPGDVEAALAAHPALAAAAVRAWEGAGGEMRLAAYVVPRAAAALPGGAELRAFLRRRLPEAMVPASFTPLAAMPLTAHGKVDRRRLPLPAPPAAADRAAAAWSPRAAPRTPTEELLAGIWAEALGCSRVDADDEFFALGGHSLAAARVAARLREPFGVDLPLAALFDHPTLRQLAAEIDRLRAAAAPTADPAADLLAPPPLLPTPGDAAAAGAPLSFSQERLWFLDQLDPGSPVYNLPAAVRIDGTLATPLLRRALAAVVGRQAALRTTITASRGLPRQAAAPHRAAAALPEIDLTALPAGAGAAEAGRLAAAAALQPFDLTAGPLFRAALLALRGARHHLLVTFHHIVADGWSVRLFFDELAVAYGVLHGAPAAPDGAALAAALPPLSVQYGDYARWQREWLRGAALERPLAYWRRRLAGIPANLELPLDRPRPAMQTYRGFTRRLHLDAPATAALRALARAHGATLFMTLGAAFATLLGRYTGQRDVVLGVPTANRPRLELEPLVGFFANSLALRVDLAGDPAFGALLARLRAAALADYAHQEVPFEKLVEDLRPERDLSHNPIFQVAFALEDAAWQRGRDLPGARLTPLPPAAGTAKFDLALYMGDDGDCVSGLLEANRDLFDAATGRRWLGHFAALLGAAARDAGRPLSQLPLVGPGERHQLLVEANDTRQPAPREPFVHRWFAARAAERPAAPALSQVGAAADRSLTYGELNQRANRLAHRLLRLGVGPEVRVAVAIERSPELIVAFLAVLKAGGAYVPLDPAYPAERLAFLLADSAAPILLTQGSLAGSFAAAGAGAGAGAVTTLLLDGAAFAGEPAHDPAVAQDPRHLAYVIYTSGSTGRPKGVMVDHAALARYTAMAVAAYAVEPADRVLQFCALSFDISIEEIVPCLATGGELVLRSDAMLGSVATFLAACHAAAITLLSLPTAYWHDIVAMAEAEDLALPPALRLVIIAGERALPKSLAAWLRRAPERPRLLNTYGLTESTVVSTVADLTAAAHAATPAAVPREVPIGRGVAGSEIYLLDRAGVPAPLGVPGELHVGGHLLARGYLHRPEVTAERFVPHPFAALPGARLYRTGDLGRQLPAGDLEFLGRGDHQVKIRGYRIEPGEIETALVEHPAIAAAVVVVREDGPGRKRLVAYTAPRPGAAAVSAEAMRAFLRHRLPDYMLPAVLVPLDRLPLTPNGKVDRAALPAPASHLGGGAPYVAPAGDTELRVAAIWRQLLGVERVGTHDNFFDLGGHSLLLLQLHERLREDLAADLPLADLFKYPTVAALARHLRQPPAASAAGVATAPRERPAQQGRERGAQSRAAAGRGRFLAARRKRHE